MGGGSSAALLPSPGRVDGWGSIGGLGWRRSKGVAKWGIVGYGLSSWKNALTGVSAGCTRGFGARTGCVLFTGEYEHTIDAKHRVAIPSDIRSRLSPERHGEAFYLAPGPDTSLWLWPEKTFEDLASASEQSLLPDEDLMEFEELLYSQSSRAELDSAGRIRIPERLMKLAGLGSSVMILGVKDHLELRDPAAWTARRDEKLAKQAEIVMRARRALARQRNQGGD